MRKGVENSEEWLNTLKNSMEEYSAAPPKQGWKSLSVAMIKRNAQRRRLKFVSVFSAVAAVALLFLLLPFTEPQNGSVEGGIAVVENLEDDLVRDKEVIESAVVEDNMVRRSAVKKEAVRSNVATISESKNNVDRGVVGKSATGNEVGKSGEDKSEAYIGEEDKSEEEKHEVQKRGVQRSEVQKYEVEKSNANKSDVERDSDKSSGLTWEEYLAAEPNKSDRKGKKLKNLLALQVGNGSTTGYKPSTLSFSKGECADAPSDVYSQGDLGFTSNPVLGNSVGNQTLTNVEKNDDVLNSVQSLPLYNLPEPELVAGVRGLTREYNHKQPITFSLMVGKELSKRFTVESGLSYTILRSNLYIVERDETLKQQLHYIGLPLRFNWNFVNKPSFLAYAGAGAILEKSIYSKLGSVKLDINTLNVAGTLGAGAQYRISNNFGIYLEPSMVYYFGMGNSDVLDVTASGLVIKSVRSEYPLGFLLNGGFRFSF